MVKAALYSGILALLTFFVWRGIVPGWNEVSTDFSNYYVSSRLLVEGDPLDSLYDSEWFRRKGAQMGAPQAQKFSPFPPITAFAALPFVWLEVLPAQRLSVVLDVLLICLCVPLIRRISGWTWPSSVFFLLVLGHGLANNVRLGQVYVAILFATLLGYLLLSTKNDRSIGVIYALIAAIKYFAVIYLPAFWMTGRKKVILVFFTTIAVLVLFQVAFFGKAVFGEYVSASLLPHLDGYVRGQGNQVSQFQSWESFLSLLIADEFIVVKTILKYLIVAMLLSTTVIAIRNIKRLPKEFHLNALLGILGITGFVLLPASATYHFVMLAFPVMLITSLPGLDTRYRYSILIIYSGIGFIPYQFFYVLSPRLWAITALYIVTVVAIARLAKSVRA